MNEKQLQDTIKAHDNVIADIRQLDSRLQELSPTQLAQLQYMYTKAERHAWSIASHYKGLQKYYEGLAEVSQGTTYKNLREDKEANKTSVDAQYESRIAKGNMLIEAGVYEGLYTSWKGWSASYEGARNAIKDMIKSVDVEGGK
jgi:DNA repair exonuclease SbcCD ATPase subunit